MRISDWSSDVCSSDLKKDIGRSLIGHHEVRTVSPDYLKAAAAGWHAKLIGDVDDITIDIHPADRSPGQELVPVFCQRAAAHTADLARFWRWIEQPEAHHDLGIFTYSHNIARALHCTVN